MMKDRLEKQYIFMERNLDIDVCGNHALGENEQYNIICHIEHQKIINELLFNPTMIHPSVILRKESLLKVFPDLSIYNPEFIFAEDYYLWVRLVMCGFKFYNLPENLIKYRISENQNTIKYKDIMLRHSLAIKDLYLEYLVNKIVVHKPELFDYIEKSILLIIIE